MYTIDKKYLVPVEEISCPGCGQKYGHHNTNVDLISQECSKCCKSRDDVVEMVSAKFFIESILEITPNEY
jgi:hypothetical protein